MLRIVSCIAVQHDLLHLIFAAVICVMGAMLTMRLFSRVRRTQGLQKLNWLFLSGFVGGSSIWTTHFVAMLGYETPVVNGYDPVLTLISLLLAVFVTLAGFAIASHGQKSALVEAGGVIVGLGVVVMHYVGIAAYRAAGHLEWDRSYVVASIFLAAIFGAVAVNRMVRPATRYCKHYASLALVLAIVLAHFTGMAGLTIVVDPMVAPPQEMISHGHHDGYRLCGHGRHSHARCLDLHHRHAVDAGSRGALPAPFSA